MNFYSIITVNLNDVNGLKKTFKSIKNQSYKSYEHIIVDGDSLDGSKKFLKNLNHNKIKKIIGKDRGIYDAMNKGIKISKGKFLIFLNSGDTFFSNSSLEIMRNNISNFSISYFGKARIIGKYYFWNNPNHEFAGKYLDNHIITLLAMDPFLTRTLESPN